MAGAFAAVRLVSMTSLRTAFALALASISLAACTSNGACGAGEPVGDFCAYSTSSAIVIEGGFHCPAELPMEFAFGGAILCGPTGATPDRAESACLSGGFECGPPSCDIAPDREDCRPAMDLDGGVSDAGFGPCDAGPVDFCREHMPAFGPGCCGDSVSPLCRIGGSGYACPEGSIASSECTMCL